MPPIRQCAILVGGRGTRLGPLTAGTPKPLLPCGDRPFLAWILCELSRFGIDDVLLLAGHQSDSVLSFCRDVYRLLPRPLSIQVSVEPSPAGTGGALWYARDLLSDRFLMMNGDSWFDTNLALFVASHDEGSVASILLRSMPDCSRYGTVDLQGTRIKGFREKAAHTGSGLISSGIYTFTREILNHIEAACSLEQDVFPRLAEAGLLSGSVLDGYFIDIGIPEDYQRAQHEIPRRLCRP
jgi:D-glycero-D-manno-heptose 1,7-bisphosphate phosphatase